MKHFIIFPAFFVLLAVYSNVHAQEKATTSVASVARQGQDIYVSLIASRPFIFANNRYILHIGSQEFYRNKQTTDSGKGKMTFFIPLTDFDQLPEGGDMYLTYGKMPMTNKDPQQISKENFTPCWYLGKFSKTILTK